MGMTMDALRRMRDAVGDDDEIIADILQSFLEEVEILVSSLGSAVATEDSATVRRIAHTLKSSCHDLGDQTAGDLCAQLEELAHTGELQDAPAIASSVTEACLSLAQEVRTYLSGQSSLRA